MKQIELERIKEVMKPREYYSFSDICEELGVFCSASRYLRAWDDLKASGRIQEGLNNKWKVIQ